MTKNSKSTTKAKSKSKTVAGGHGKTRPAPKSPLKGKTKSTA